MNLSAYDKIRTKVDKSKSWVNIKERTIYSRDIKYRKYCAMVSRYDSSHRTTDYFIVMSTEPIDNTTNINHEIDDYGRTKIKLYSLYDKIGFNKFTKDSNITIIKVDTQRDGEIYQIIF